MLTVIEILKKEKVQIYLFPLEKTLNGMTSHAPAILNNPLKLSKCPSTR